MTLLVIEMNSFHLELLPMYRPLLPSLFGHRLDIRYFVLPALSERARHIVGPEAENLNPAWLKYVLPSKPLRARYYRHRIQRLIDDLHPVAVIFNTIEPSAYWRVFRQIRHALKIGIVHNPRRNGTDYSARAPGELVFCLHDYNYEILKRDRPVDGYVSPFFKNLEVQASPADGDQLEIAVQGVISFNRRDYPLLLSAGERWRRRPPSRPVVFNILGDARLRDGPRLRQLVRDRGLEDCFRFHVGLSDRQFFDELARASFIMPLVHDRSDTYTGAAKVTAAYGHSGAYRIPMVLHPDTAALWGVPADACVTFESPDDLGDRIAQGGADRAEMAARYGRLIDAKIHRNQRVLEAISRDHPGFGRNRRSRVS